MICIAEDGSREPGATRNALAVTARRCSAHKEAWLSNDQATHVASTSTFTNVDFI